MTEKIIFLFSLTILLYQAVGILSINANIDKIISKVENHTKGLFEDGKAIVLYNWTNDNNSHSYMIQKENEKLSIIPMFPIAFKKIDNIQMPLNNNEEDGN